MISKKPEGSENCMKANLFPLFEIEKNKAPFQTSHIFMTTQKRYYGPGTNTSSIRNVKIKASNDTDWAVVEVNLDTRHEETYSRNSAYTAISFNLTIPSVLDNCTHIFENKSIILIYIYT